MLRLYYVDEITGISEQELCPIFQTGESPACLLDGWALHLHVNDGFREEYGHEYIGSRYVDLGFHLDPNWDRDELEAKPIGRLVHRVMDHGYISMDMQIVDPELLATIKIRSILDLLSPVESPGFNQEFTLQ